MNIGDYVRTKYGIAKLVKIDEDEYFFDNTIAEYSSKFEHDYIRQCFEENLNVIIIKSSSNIIDLIEVGDYVNGYKVYEENGYLWIKRVSDDEYKVPHYTRIDFEEFKIKSILTKEQFESMKYKVGDKENEYK